MKRQQLTAILMSAIITMSACIPITGISAMASETGGDLEIQMTAEQTGIAEDTTAEAVYSVSSEDENEKESSEKESSEKESSIEESEISFVETVNSEALEEQDNTEEQVLPEGKEDPAEAENLEEQKETVVQPASDVEENPMETENLREQEESAKPKSSEVIKEGVEADFSDQKDETGDSVSETFEQEKATSEPDSIDEKKESDKICESSEQPDQEGEPLSEVIDYNEDGIKETVSDEKRNASYDEDDYDEDDYDDEANYTDPLVLEESSVILTAGSVYTIYSNLFGENIKSAVSSNKSIATVSSDVISIDITAKKPGKTKITVTGEYGTKCYVDVTVKTFLTRSSASVNAGSKKLISLVSFDDIDDWMLFLEPKDFSTSSSDKAVVTASVGYDDSDDYDTIYVVDAH